MPVIWFSVSPFLVFVLAHAFTVLFLLSVLGVKRQALFLVMMILNDDDGDDE